ncbi:hypothetical protein VSS22_24565 [Klebsiella pneumoniae]|jgi:L-asparagine transporter-like permease|uniref:hypothetical protein n=1 Tax=Klebsiella TaxID=570 RepID=UPI0018C4BF89|nr:MULTISPECIES: hypothetical protein [Klebsiella]HCC2748845.1 hypothetical protein [Klebsiella quasipneumoniae]HCP7680475.1 hypothetical protein [Escherichia coli]MBD7346137.1 hypothetical protein [Klebsiella pneumoniae]MBD7356874.1 hypothetical protein [Klebsiella pneumoniae]MBD7367505.1 hypothetical protein [Klebsiella pneumoniae]
MNTNNMSELSSLNDKPVDLTSLLMQKMAIFLICAVVVILLYCAMKKDFTYLKSVSILAAIFATLVIVISSVVYIIKAEYENEKQWTEWASVHCKIVAKKDGHLTTGVGFTIKGVMGFFTGSQPSQTGYQCDDGLTYWKND